MIRVAQILLRFYPSGFRARYEAEVISLLRDQAEDVRRREGWFALLRMWLFQVADLLRAGRAERRGEPARGAPGGAPEPEPRYSGSRRRPEGLGRDLRHAVRMMMREPGMTIVAVLTLALGIGATAAIFTVIDGVLLAPLPYPEPGELVAVYHRVPALNAERVDHTSSTYLTYHDGNRVFDSMGAWVPTEVAVTGLDEPERVEVLAVSEGVFPTLRVAPALGRGFVAADAAPDAPLTVVLSHGYWSRRFGEDPAVLGRTLRIAGEAAEIIGVMGAEFRFLDRDAALYRTLRFDRSSTPTVLSFDYRVLARLRPGVDEQAAVLDLRRLLPVSVERYGWVPQTQLDEWGLDINVMPLKDAVVGNVGSVLWMLFGTVGLVLLIACANVANLLLVRVEGRRREIAMRTALGASWGRVARQFVVESAVVSLVGAAAGLFLARAAVPVLIRMAPTVLPRVGEIAVGGRVLLFTLLLSLAASVVFGLFPLLQRSDIHLRAALADGGRGAGRGRSSHRVRNGLAIVEVALAVVLLIGAGLMVRSSRALRSVDPGFSDPRSALTFRLSLPPAEAPDDDQAIAVYERVVGQIAQIPGVTAVGAISGLTMEGRSNQNSFLAEGVAVDPTDGALRGAYKAIAGDYFAAAGIPVVAGRSIDWRDIRERRPVGVVTETLAREFWGSAGAAIGKRIRHAGNDPWREIVGVVGDVRDGGLRGAPRPVAFWPVLVEDFLGFDSWLRRDMAFVVRARRVDPLALVGQVREAVWAVNPNLPLADVGTLDRLVERDLAGTSFTLSMLLTAAVVAVALGTIGIYGVISYVFEQRTREIGVRVALGARHADVLAMVLRQGVAIGTVGVGIGVLAAAGLSRFLASQLFGIEALDPSTYVLAGAAVLALVVLASAVPARRAARADPLVSLRR